MVVDEAAWINDADSSGLWAQIRMAMDCQGPKDVALCAWRGLGAIRGQTRFVLTVVCKSLSSLC